MKYLILILSILFCVNFYVRAEEKPAATVGTGNIDPLPDSNQKITLKADVNPKGSYKDRHLNAKKIESSLTCTKYADGRCMPTSQVGRDENTNPPKAEEAAAPAANSPAAKVPAKAK